MSDYESRFTAGSTITGTTTPNVKYEMGANSKVSPNTNARYATLMVESGGQITFGRNRTLGNYHLAAGDAYSFDYVDVSTIVVLDNGTATKFTIDFTGP